MSSLIIHLNYADDHLRIRALRSDDGLAAQNFSFRFGEADRNAPTVEPFASMLYYFLGIWVSFSQVTATSSLFYVLT
jgi:hypothetical protein